MAKKIWRISHLLLAVFSSAFLLVISVTGAILAADSAWQRIRSGAESSSEEPLSEVIARLQEKYPDILELKRSDAGYTELQIFDEEGNEERFNINPKTGEKISESGGETHFISQVKTLHRSFFLHETGRAIAGIFAFLLVLIIISGSVLLAKRNGGWLKPISKIRTEFPAQFLHILASRIFSIPLLISAVSGTVLCLFRFNLIPESEVRVSKKPEAGSPVSVAEFPVLRKIKLGEVQKIQFPLDAEDPEEHFKIILPEKMLLLSPRTGTVLEEHREPFRKNVEVFLKMLHTGNSSAAWSVVLGLASLGIPIFIWSGFAIWYRRSWKKIKNEFEPSVAEIIILVGSENGTTFQFAQKIHQQFASKKIKSTILNLDDYAEFPAAKHLLIFTATSSDGEAPQNALKFKDRLEQINQNHKILVSVVGFGSASYPKFCGYAGSVFGWIKGAHWAQLLPLYKINEKNYTEFSKWAQYWAEQSGIPLAHAAEYYQSENQKVESFMIIENILIDEKNSTHCIRFKPTAAFRSGDLLGIYPQGKERFYSIGSSQSGDAQILVKHYKDGIGSGLLCSLRAGNFFSGKILENKNFRLDPAVPEVVMIANGTGVAPFLGMLNESSPHQEISILCGFRFESELSELMKCLPRRFSNVKMSEVAISRGGNPRRVTDLMNQNSLMLRRVLESGGVVMLCGSLAMYRDSVEVMKGILGSTGKDFEFYKNAGQIVSDCY